MNVPVLLADIGGTNARFALGELDGEATGLRDGSVREFAVADFPSLPDTAKHYLAAVGAQPTHAVIAVAGRVDGDEARITNHPWVISGARVRQTLGLHDLRLINDFAAQSMAVPLLRAGDVVPLGGVGWHEDVPSADRSYAVRGPG